MPLKQVYPALGAFAVLGGVFRREKCNMLQKSLVEMVVRLNTGRKKAIIEEKSATCCKNLF